MGLMLRTLAPMARARRFQSQSERTKPKKTALMGVKGLHSDYISKAMELVSEDNGLELFYGM